MVETLQPFLSIKHRICLGGALAFISLIQSIEMSTVVYTTTPLLAVITQVCLILIPVDSNTARHSNIQIVKLIWIKQGCSTN